MPGSQVGTAFGPPDVAQVTQGLRRRRRPLLAAPSAQAAPDRGYELRAVQALAVLERLGHRARRRQQPLVLQLSVALQVVASLLLLEIRPDRLHVPSG